MPLDSTCAAVAAAFFADNRVIWSCSTQPGDDHRFGFAIELGHHVGVGELGSHDVHPLAATDAGLGAGSAGKVLRQS